MNLRAHETKRTLKTELRVIPPIGWVVAGVVLLLWMALAVPFVVQLEDKQPGEPEPPLWALGAVMTFAGVVLAIWVLMVFYVNADARRRQMNVLLWTLLVIFIPNAIGFIVYFLLRQPIARPCTKCRAPLRPEFAFCPACGERLTGACPACRHAVEPNWANCAFCGAKLS